MNPDDQDPLITPPNVTPLRRASQLLQAAEEAEEDTPPVPGQALSRPDLVARQEQMFQDTLREHGLRFGRLEAKIDDLTSLVRELLAGQRQGNQAVHEIARKQEARGDIAKLQTRLLVDLTTAVTALQGQVSNLDLHARVLGVLGPSPKGDGGT